MNDTIDTPPGWLRIVAVIAVLWNLVGVYFYLVHAGVVQGPAMSESDRALAETMPAWLTASFAIGVFAGTIGSLGLLLLKRWARPLLWLSLAALALLESWYLLVSGAPAALGPSSIPLPVAIVVIAALLAWLANRAVRKGWLR